MQFSYDPRYNIGYIRLREKGSQVESIKISDELIVDMTPDGMVYGIELLNANEQLQRDNMDKLTFVNEATGEHSELKLSLG
jgi:uncharacterized protein YuzE